MPCNSCGEYQIWVSLAVCPSVRYGEPSCQFSGPLNSTMLPSPRPLMNPSSVEAFVEDRAGPLSNPAADVSKLLMFDQSGPSHVNWALNELFIADCTILR